MSTTERKISVRNKVYTNNKFVYQREERIQIISAKEMSHRVVGGVAVGAAGVIGPAYAVAVGLEPRAITGSKLGEDALVRPGQQLFGWVNWRVETPGALCWVPETGRSPLSSGLVGGVWLRGKRPPPVRHQR